MTTRQAEEEKATVEAVISRHWPTGISDSRMKANPVAPDKLRGIIQELCDVRMQLTLERAADAKVLSAIEALRAAEEAQAALR